MSDLIERAGELILKMDADISSWPSDVQVIRDLLKELESANNKVKLLGELVDIDIREMYEKMLSANKVVDAAKSVFRCRWSNRTRYDLQEALSSHKELNDA